MKSWQITLSIIMLFVIGIIFYSLQKGNLNPEIDALKKLNATPTPVLIDPNKTQQAQQQQQQAQQQHMMQQQQQVAPVQVLPQDQMATSAAIVTSKGTIKIELYGSDAPGTVSNFITKARSNFYNNLTFHRVEDWVIQGGDPQGTGAGGGNIPVEFNTKPFEVGSVGVASRGDGVVQNDSQFFITKTDASHLNGKYTNFGKVIDGMDVVNKIAIGDKIQEIKLE
jgi:peptidyl-prolyl cis-trans isomerase B (cyclophilin B)